MVRYILKNKQFLYGLAFSSLIAIFSSPLSTLGNHVIISINNFLTFLFEKYEIFYYRVLPIDNFFTNIIIYSSTLSILFFLIYKLEFVKFESSKIRSLFSGFVLGISIQSIFLICLFTIMDINIKKDILEYKRLYSICATKSEYVDELNQFNRTFYHLVSKENYDLLIADMEVCDSK